jgi:hypothetical protein
LRHKHLSSLMVSTIILTFVFIHPSNATSDDRSSILSKSQAITARSYISKAIFGSSNRLLKTSVVELPTFCSTNPLHKYCATWGNKYNLKVYKVVMEKGISSLVFEISPMSYKRIVLWCRGHFSSELENSPNFYQNIEKTLSSQNKIFLFSMPFMYPNDQFSYVGINQFVKIKIGPDHNQFSLLSGSVLGSPLKYFFQPELAILDKYVKRDEVVAMTGLSGGGWTSTVLSSIEPRIKLTYAVAGSLPFSIRDGVEADLGDWEQWLVGIFPKYGYLDLYVLGTYPGRTVVNVYNVADECCFSARTGYLEWAKDVTIKSEKLNGKFRVVLEDSSAHDFGPKAFEAFLNDLNRL